MAKLKSAYTGGLIEIEESQVARFVEQGWLRVDDKPKKTPKKKTEKK